MVANVLDNPVLVLNKSWLAHDSITVRDSFGCVLSERALFLNPDDGYAQPHNLVSWCEQPILKGNSSIRIPGRSIKKPEIMVLVHYNKVPKRTVVFNRRNIYKRDKGLCQYCGCRPASDDWSIDHIHPRSKGGLSTFQNCVLSCTKCNLTKADRTPEQAGMRLRTMKKDKRSANWVEVYYKRPKHPQWNPFYALTRKQFPASWKQWLSNIDDVLYWEVELLEK